MAKKTPKPKHWYNVYRIETYFGPCGEMETNRYYIGQSYAVSPAKASCNVQYNLYGKAFYCGGDVIDLGCDAGMDISFEAVLAYPEAVKKPMFEETAKEKEKRIARELANAQVTLFDCM